MEHSIYGFQYDFIAKNGTFLVLSREEGLRQTDLKPIQVKMLQSNSVPGLLPVEMEEIDHTVRLRYNITSKRMLSQLLKTEKLTLHEYFRLMLQIATVLEETQGYMLDRDRFVLREDFMFTGMDIADVCLVYVPADFSAEKVPFRDELRKLATGWIGYIREIEGSAIQEMLSLMREDEFDLRGLRQLLLSLLMKDWEKSDATKAASRKQGKNPELPMNPLTDYTDGLAAGTAREQRPRWIPRLNARTDPKQDERGMPAVEIEETRREEGTGGQSAESAVELEPRKKMFVFAAALSILLLIWSFYSDASPAGSMLLMAGCSLLLLDTVFILVRLRPDLLQKGGKGGVSSREPNSSFRLQPFSTPTTALAAGFHDPESADVINPMPVRVEQEQAFVERIRNADPTTMLRKPDATVFLSHDAMEAFQRNRIRARLEIVKGDGNETTVPLNADRFVVGREPSVCDYTEDTPGVSKMHAEFLRHGTGYAVKDLGSTNGSRLNDEPMVPYKEYMLKHGDLVRIVATQFVFKTE